MEVESETAQGGANVHAWYFCMVFLYHGILTALNMQRWFAKGGILSASAFQSKSSACRVINRVADYLVSITRQQIGYPENRYNFIIAAYFAYAM